MWPFTKKPKETPAILLAGIIISFTDHEITHLLDVSKGFSAIEDISKRVTSQECFREVLAYYNFIVLITVANYFNLAGLRLDLLGGETCLSATEVASPHYADLIHRCFASDSYHQIVAQYMSFEDGDTGFTKEDFDSIVKIVGFEQHQNDFLMKSYVLSFARLLTVLSLKDKYEDFRIVTQLWIAHVSTINASRKTLNDILKRPFFQSLK